MTATPGGGGEGGGGGQGGGTGVCGDGTIGGIFVCITDAIGQGFNFIANFFTNLFDLFGQFINWVIGTAANFLTIIGNVIQTILGILNQAIELVRQIAEIIRILVEIVIRLIQLFGQWIAQAGVRLGGLIASFFSAPPTPIGGLPLCISQPMQYDICAIYYIFDNTLMAPGTPGQLIIPILLVDMNIWMIAYFGKFALKLLRRGENVTSVG